VERGLSPEQTIMAFLEVQGGRVVRSISYYFFFGDIQDINFQKNMVMTR
jgi:hypothetical protein